MNLYQNITFHAGGIEIQNFDYLQFKECYSASSDTEKMGGGRRARGIEQKWSMSYRV